MTNPYDPVYTYPSPDAREVWVPCSKDDSNREEYWCSGGLTWKREIALTQLCKSDGCDNRWRKRVPVPDSWAIAPEDYLWDGRSEMKSLQDGEWLKHTWSEPVRISDAMGVCAKSDGCLTYAFIQPIYQEKPATKSESDKVIELLIFGCFVSEQEVEEVRAFLRKL